MTINLHQPLTERRATRAALARALDVLAAGAIDAPTIDADDIERLPEVRLTGLIFVLPARRVALAVALLAANVKRARPSDAQRRAMMEGKAERLLQGSEYFTRAAA